MPARQKEKWLWFSAFFIGAFFVLAQTAQAQVVLNEIFANPVDENDELIELYNHSDQSQTVSGYSVSDKVKSYTFSEATISAKSFLVLLKIDSQIALNNSGEETVTLKDADGNAVDIFTYDGTVEGKSFSRVPDGTGSWLNETEVTRGTANKAPPSPSLSPTTTSSSSSNESSSTPSPTPTPSPINAPSPLVNTTASPSAMATFSGQIHFLPLEGDILGASSSSQSAANRSNLIAWILISMGVVLMAVSGGVFGYNQINAFKKQV